MARLEREASTGLLRGPELAGDYRDFPWADPEASGRIRDRVSALKARLKTLDGWEKKY